MTINLQLDVTGGPVGTPWEARSNHGSSRTLGNSGLPTTPYVEGGES